jgi:secreted trypsin-like serine protease
MKLIHWTRVALQAFAVVAAYASCTSPQPPQESQAREEEPAKPSLAPPGPPLTDDARRELEELQARWSEREKVPQETKIVGGVVAEPGEFPWAAALFRWHSPSSQWFQFCGGTLIAPDRVLTAAHCRVRVTDLVLLGRDDLTTSAGEVHEIAAVTSHDAYDPETNDSDISVIQLKVPSEQTTVQLLDNDEATAAGEESTVIGWGHTEQGGPGSEKLRKVTIPFVDWNTCNTNYENALTDNMLCAGEEGKDSCQGDSGGGLLVYEAAQGDGGSGSYRVAGVVSFGIGCAQAKYPGVYTKVTNYRDWVQQTVSSGS